MLILGTLLVPMYYIKVGKDFTTDPDGRLENALDAFEQMKNSWMICLATVGMDPYLIQISSEVNLQLSFNSFLNSCMTSKLF